MDTKTDLKANERENRRWAPMGLGRQSGHFDWNRDSDTSEYHLCKTPHCTPHEKSNPLISLNTHSTGESNFAFKDTRLSLASRIHFFLI